ncbi:hypothetical protein ABXT06_22075 [Flavobacterium sp. UW10123]|uniref:hypothetical protein n=1 Tax=Flavobacterium sp. UW10123 TaxID=3230800 RepID=UPI003391EFCE
MSNRSTRRKIERDIKNQKKKNRIPVQQILHNLKYSYDDESKQLQVLNSFTLDNFNAINGNPLPKTFSQLGEGGHTYSHNDIIKEIRWYTYNIKKYTEQINLYIELKDVLDSNILLGNYDVAKEILKKINDEICISHWSIEQNFIIAEYQGGFKKNKEILSELINSENQDLTNIFARYQSIRVEKNLSFFTYEEILEQYVKKHPSYLQDLLNFKLNFFKSDPVTNSGFILGFLNGFSIIDNYNLYIDFISLILSLREKNPLHIESIKKSLIELSSLVNDVRISNLLIYLEEPIDIKFSDDNILYLKILDYYTEGQYYEVIDKAKELLLKNSLFFEVYHLYIKSLINLGLDFENFFNSNSIANQTLSALNNVIRKNNYYHDSISYLYKIYNSLGLNSWTSKLYFYFSSENSNYNTTMSVQQFSLMYSSYYNPAFSITLEKSSIDYLNKFSTTNNTSQTISFWKNICSKLFNLENNIIYDENKTASYREAFYKVKILEANQDFKNALQEYVDLENDINFKYEINLPHNQEDLIHSKLKCLLNLDELDKAIDLTIESLFTNKYLKNRLCSKFLIDKITSFNNEKLLQNISSSILLHYYQQLIDDNDLWIAYDEFMAYEQLDFPKELEKNQKKFSKPKLIYFLKNICKQEIYDSSPSFESQDELDNERVEICRLLSELDNENFEDYINEIAEINRNQLIRKGIKQIDESKIYVDVNGIKNSLEKEIRESFERSLNLFNLPIEQIKKIDDTTERVLIPYFTKNTETKNDSSQSVQLTSYSRFTQFSDMFSKIRDKFIASNEFGIDTYLSMRIRHGTLLGEIRSVFELYNLITKKEDTSNKYQENIFWKDKLHLKSKLMENVFDDLMSKFSSEIDNICNDLKNNKIQIKTEKKNSEGLFDYSFSEFELIQIFKHQIGGINQYEDFFDTVITILWERTEKILYNIRDNISNSVKPQMIKLLADLSRNLETQIDKFEYSELNEIISNIISCQTEISNELDKISSWFKRSNSKSINEFEIDLPINASLTILKRIFKEFSNLNPKIEIDCNIKFEGENFPHFTYIMQNLFHNILAHSKLSSRELNIKIEANINNNIFSLTVENNFSKSLSLEEINKKINNTMELLLETHDNEKTRAEDGTGYIKIRKTLVTDLSRKNYSIVIHEVDEQRIFKTLINFEINNLQKIVYNENINN